MSLPPPLTTESHSVLMSQLTTKTASLEKMYNKYITTKQRNIELEREVHNLSAGILALVPLGEAALTQEREREEEVEERGAELGALQVELAQWKFRLEIREKNQATVEEKIVAWDEELKQRERELEARSDEQRKKEDTLAEMEENRATKWGKNNVAGTLGETESDPNNFIEREQELEERENELVEKENEMMRKEDHLAAWGDAMEGKKKELVAKEASIVEEGQESWRKMALRNCLSCVRQEKSERHKLALDKREERLVEREKNVVERELELATRDAVLCEGKYALDPRENLIERAEPFIDQERADGADDDTDVQMEDATTGTDAEDASSQGIEEFNSEHQDHQLDSNLSHNSRQWDEDKAHGENVTRLATKLLEMKEELDANIGRLMAPLSQVRNENTGLQTQLDEAEARILDLKQNLRNSVDEITELKIENASIPELREILETSLSGNLELEQRISSYLQDIIVPTVGNEILEKTLVEQLNEVSFRVHKLQEIMSNSICEPTEPRNETENPNGVQQLKADFENFKRKCMKRGPEHVALQEQIEKLEEGNAGLRRRIFPSPYFDCSPLEGAYIAPSGTSGDVGEPLCARGGNGHAGYQSIRQQLDLLMEESAMSPDAYVAQPGVMVEGSEPGGAEKPDDVKFGDEGEWEDEADNGGHSDLGEYGGDAAGEDEEVLMAEALKTNPYETQVEDEDEDDEELIHG